MSLKQLESALQLGFRKGDIDVIGRVLLEETRERKAGEETIFDQLNSLSTLINQAPNSYNKELQARVDVLEKSVAALEKSVDTFKKKVTALEKRLKKSDT